MSEELIQKNLVEAPEKMGDWNFYNIGATTLKALKGAKIIYLQISQRPWGAQRYVLVL